MDDYQIALRKWAAAKIDSPAVSWRDIVDVGVETDSGWGGSDVTPGDPASVDLIARTADRRYSLADLLGNGMYAARYLDFGVLLRELAAIEITDADRVEGSDTP